MTILAQLPHVAQIETTLFTPFSQCANEIRHRKHTNMITKHTASGSISGCIASSLCILYFLFLRLFIARLSR